MYISSEQAIDIQMAGTETCPILNLLPLLLMLQSPAQFTPSCQSSIDGKVIESKCAEEFKNPSSGEHRVEVNARGKLDIQYRCKGPSTVQVQVEPYAITLDVREFQDGAWHSRGVGKVEWSSNGSIRNHSLSLLGGGCSSEKGFTIRQGPPQVLPPGRREIQHWDHPLPSHGLGG